MNIVSAGDGFALTAKYSIYGLPVDIKADKGTLKNSSRWTKIVDGELEIML